MKREFEDSLRSFLIEFVVYAVLVAAYYLLVLHWLGHWLQVMFERERQVYAWVALGLIIGQGVVLDTVTKLLLPWLRRRAEDG